jgi:hypothetical protein
MYAPHALKSEGAGIQSPDAQAFQVADVAKDGIDSLYTSGVCDVYDALTRIE